MSDGQSDDSWKLKLRYGRLETPYTHYTAIADGIAGQLVDGFSCRPGPAYMGLKTWAESADESADMARVIGSDIGFTVTGRIQVYEVEPLQPPGENPRAYDIKFTSYDSDT